MAETTPAPLTCISVVLCDDVFRDETTQKVVLVGAFTVVNAPSLPFVLPRMAVFATLTGGHGDHRVSLEVEHEATGTRVFHIKGPLTLSNPLDLADIDLRLSNLKLLDSGKYWVIIKDEERILAQRPFMVRLVPMPENNDGTPDPA